MDMNTLLPIILSLISGGVGGNIAGALLKQFSLGPIGNSIVGVLGGAAGGALMSHLPALASTGTAGNVGGSAVGGAILMAIIGAVKNAMAGQATKESAATKLARYSLFKMGMFFFSRGGG